MKKSSIQPTRYAAVNAAIKIMCHENFFSSSLNLFAFSFTEGHQLYILET